jgi:hypothetical protein
MPDADDVQKIEHKNGIIINCCKAYTILILNLVLPGLGTWIGCTLIEDKKIKHDHYGLGLCQLLTSPFLLGWCFAFCHSYLFITAYHMHCSIEDIYQNDSSQKVKPVIISN